MTEQHKCDWKLFRSDHGMPWGFACRLAIDTSGIECGAELTIAEAESRLNEHETLKKATDALTVALQNIADTSPNWMQKDAVADSERRMRTLAQDALQACADILEGKDETRS